MFHKLITKITKAPDYHSLKNNLKHLHIIQTDQFLKKYSIIEALYERADRGVYVIKNYFGIKYILKFKKCLDGQEPHICSILKSNFHPNIITVIDIMMSQDHYCIVYEYFDGINLQEYFSQNHFPASNNDIVCILKQIINGTKYLHMHNIIHCDLKLENILINKKSKQLKIIDFDLSIVSTSEYLSDRVFGTLQYISPETYDLHIYSKKSDIWSIGVILYIMITTEYPNTINNDNNELIEMYNGICRKNSFKNIDFDIVLECINNNGYNPKLYDIVKSMLIFQDNKRSTIDELLKKIDF